MGARIELTGKVFGRLLIVKYHGFGSDRRARWECLCNCGKTKIALAKLLLNGKTKSCGCLRSESTTKKYTKHGHSKHSQHTPEFITWMNIKARCYNPKNSHYKYYGARGIKVCDRWLQSFSDFLEDVGLRPSSDHSIDRYPNNDGHYEPGNIRWATDAQQAVNKSSNRMIIYMGIKKTISEWGKEFGVRGDRIGYHLDIGKTMKEIDRYFKSEQYAKKKATANERRRLQVANARPAK